MKTKEKNAVVKKEEKEKIKTTLFQIRLPDDMLENLSKIAKRAGSTRNQYVLSTLLEDIKKSKPWAFTQE